MKPAPPRPYAEWIVLTLALGLHLVCLDRFGWFRDELYYLACGARPAWGYVDHPPLVAFAAAGARWLGDSFLAIRALPILVGLLTVALTFRMATRLGARGAGRVLAGLATLLCPTYLFQFHHLNMNAFEVALWSGGALLALELDASASWRRWLGFGAVVGIGLLNKHSMGFWVVALAAGFLVGGRHRVFLSWKPWVAMAVAVGLVAPHVFWQWQNGFPTLEFYRNAAAFKNQPPSPWGFVAAQITLAGPGNFVAWLVGLGWLLVAKAARPFRPLGVAYFALLAIFLLGRGKAYYLVPFYPVLFAAGGAGLEAAVARWRRLAFLRFVVPGLALGVGGLVLPLALPLLSPEATIAWGKRLGIAPPKAERAALGALPQHFADMFGWESLVDTLARVRDGLPPAEQAGAQIWVNNYGEAAAVEWLGREKRLPPVFSAHNAYFMWGPPAPTDPVIVLGRPGTRPADLAPYFKAVEYAGRSRCVFCMPFESDLPVFIGRGWQRSPSEIWPGRKHYF